MGDATSPARTPRRSSPRAVRNDGELRVVYQPLIDMRSGRPIGAEALVRWEHPTDGLRIAGPVHPLAEETGLITEIGALVLNDACRQAARWVRRSTPSSTSCWSRSTCRRASCRRADRRGGPRGAGRLRARAAPAGPGDHRDGAHARPRRRGATLWQLKGLGVRIAIDDFGTGYSSLAYLRRFPIDMLKVAREFVDGLGRDAHDDVITRAIVDLAGTLGLLTVAEGIETTQQQEHVAALGCDLAQGYLFSRPYPPEFGARCRIWWLRGALCPRSPSTWRSATRRSPPGCGRTGPTGASSQASRRPSGRSFVPPGAGSPSPRPSGPSTGGQ
jgi:EAL domain-containing protein (putative c-di-GMP-specific phosphodiesterase class I)